MTIEELPVALVEMLRERGLRDEDIEAALDAGTLHFLAVDQLLGNPYRRKSALEVEEETGIDTQVLRRLWRALGFIDFADTDPIFTELDVQAAQSLRILLQSGSVEDEVAVQLARVMGSSMARFAEAQIVTSYAFGDLGDRLANLDAVELAERFTRYSSVIVPAVPQLLVYTWIRHLHAASRRAMLAFEKGVENISVVEMAVGFVDLVGFTVIAQQLSNAELAKVVGRFEEVSFDVVTQHGGRVVKMIGDEVMFVSDDPVEACEIGLSLAKIYEEDEILSEVRAGISWGHVLSQDGDYYGSTVNTASRVVNIAAPGSVLVTESVAERVRKDADLVMRALRPRYLKDLGSVQLFVARRASTGADAVPRAILGPNKKPLGSTG